MSPSWPGNTLGSSWKSWRKCPGRSLGIPAQAAAPATRPRISGQKWMDGWMRDLHHLRLPFFLSFFLLFGRAMNLGQFVAAKDSSGVSSGNRQKKEAFVGSIWSTLWIGTDTQILLAPSFIAYLKRCSRGLVSTSTAGYVALRLCSVWYYSKGDTNQRDLEEIQSWDYSPSWFIQSQVDHTSYLALTCLSTSHHLD